MTLDAELVGRMKTIGKQIDGDGKRIHTSVVINERRRFGLFILFK